MAKIVYYEILIKFIDKNHLKLALSIFLKSCWMSIENEPRSYMQKISTYKLRPGMVAALNIYNVNGNKLLSKGTVLSKKYIQRLTDLAISGVYVSVGNPSFDFDAPEDILDESIRIEATNKIYQTFQKCQLTGILDIEGLSSTTNAIIDNLLHKKK